MIAAATLLAVAVIFSLSVTLSGQPPLAPPGKVRSILRGHRGPVTAVAFSADGSALATGSWDGKVIVWDTTTAQPLHCLVFRPGTSTTEDIWPLVFAHGGDTLIASNLDGPITRVLEERLPPQAAAFKVWNLMLATKPAPSQSLGGPMASLSRRTAGPSRRSPAVKMERSRPCPCVRRASPAEGSDCSGSERLACSRTRPAVQSLPTSTRQAVLSGSLTWRRATSDRRSGNRRSQVPSKGFSPDSFRQTAGCSLYSCSARQIPLSSGTRRPAVS